MREVFGKLLASLGEKYEDLVVLTADVGDSTRASYFRERFPKRYFNVGISEQDLVDFAAGMAVTGVRPLVVNFGMFLMRAWEQIRNTIARMNLDVKFLVTHTGYSDSGDGSSHQVLEDVSLMRVLPNFKVVIPADPYDVMRSLEVVVREKGPLYYRMGRDYSPVVTKDFSYEFRIGQSAVLKEGEDLTIVGAGVVLWDAMQAAQELERMGINTAVINLLSVKPIDERTLEFYARRTGRVVTVEEHSVYGGIGSAVAEVLAKRYPVRMRMVGATGFGRSARSQRELLDYYGINAKSIIEAALEIVR
jgi:transketolase